MQLFTRFINSCSVYRVHSKYRLPVLDVGGAFVIVVIPSLVWCWCWGWGCMAVLWSASASHCCLPQVTDRLSFLPNTRVWLCSRARVCVRVYVRVHVRVRVSSLAGRAANPVTFSPSFLRFVTPTTWNYLYYWLFPSPFWHLKKRAFESSEQLRHFALLYYGNASITFYSIKILTFNY